MEQYLEDMYEIYSAHVYDAETDGEQPPDILRFVQNDKTAPHWPLIIPFSQSFVDFDPGRMPGQLVQSFYEQTFRPFLNEIEVAMASDGQIGGFQP